MTGVNPLPASGGIVIRDSAGNATNPPNVPNAYVPPDTFGSSCNLTALPNDCTARFSPAQINAIVSELIALAVAFNPSGAWTCASVTNLATNFTAWATGTGSGSLGEIISTFFEDCNGDPLPKGTAIATCADLTSAIAAALAGLPDEVHLVSGEVSGSDLVLTLSDSSTVAVDITSLIGVSQDDGNLLTDGSDGKPLLLADDVAAGICGNQSAVSTLAACLVSADAGNGIVIGSDGKLYAASSSAPALTIAKTRTGGTVPAPVGTVLTFQVVVTNVGSVAVSGIHVTDSLPETVTSDPAGLFSAGGATLAAGASATATYTYTVTAADVAAGSVVNTAAVSGVGATGSSSGVTTATMGAPCTLANTRTFSFTGADQSYTPTPGTTYIEIEMWGAGGGGGDNTGNDDADGGGGGYAGGAIASPAGTYTIVVGQGGVANSLSGSYGGGGAGGVGTTGTMFAIGAHGASGGGMSGLFNAAPSQASALLIAGGGGGGPSTLCDATAVTNGGGGGGVSGGAGTSAVYPAYTGGGGTQAAGGAAGNTVGGWGPIATAGSALQGGTGGAQREGSGGGGGGYYGGGGGGGPGSDGSGDVSGGGGSGYAAGAILSSVLTAATSPSPANTGSPAYAAGIGVGGSGGGDGGNGRVVIREYTGSCP